MKLKHYHRSMHLEEAQLMPEDPVCRFCLSKECAAVWVLQENPRITLLSCRRCHAVSASRMPTSETLAAFYDGYYHEKSYFGQETKITFDLTKKFAKHIFHIAVQRLKGLQLSFLDFGGGDGSMAVQLAKEFLKTGGQKIDIMVTDYNESLFPVDDDRICLDHRTDIDGLPDEKYELVIASAVIEHLPEPGKTLSTLLDRVNAKGLFYARTPYMLPFMKAASALGLQWDFHYPSHLHDLGPLFWNRILSIISNDRFEIIRSRPSIVETSFKKHFLRTLVAYGFKLPWFLLGNRYKMVGGWEIVAVKKG